MGFKDRFKDIKPVEKLVVSTEQEAVKSLNAPFFNDVKKKLSDKISKIPIWFEYTDEEKNELIETFLNSYVKDYDINLSGDEKLQLISKLSKSIYGFGELDFFLADATVSSVTLVEGKSVTAVQNGFVTSLDIKIEDTSFLCNKLLRLSGSKKDKSVIKFSYKNLIITLILPPVSCTYIYIKKKISETTDFEYLLKNKKIDEKIYSFLISLVHGKKSILITGKSDSGKSSYIEAFMGVIPECVLLQETPSINRESFICGGLTELETDNLLCAVNQKSTDYLIFDMNNGYIPDTCRAGISTLRADSALSAITKLAVNEAAKRNITEKQAKAKIASSFNYIIHLDKDLFISSIWELTLNKAGSLVMTEI